MTRLESHLEATVKTARARGQGPGPFELLIAVEEVLKMEPDLEAARRLYELHGCTVAEEHMPVSAETNAELKRIHGPDTPDRSEVIFWRLGVPPSVGR